MMKRIFLFLLWSLWSFVSVWAQVNPTDVTMISYEQRWLDSKGTLALKNNTDKTIRSVTFRITYMDMQGNSLDYEEFKKSVEIAPGMARKVDIPAYEYRRHYHYYKTPERLGNPIFKIKYELLDYKVKGQRASGIGVADSRKKSSVMATEAIRKTAGKKDVSSDEKESALTGVVTDGNDVEEEGYIADEDLDEEYADSDEDFSLSRLILNWYLLGIIVGLYVLVAVAARDRQRSAFLWVLMSIVVTPVLTLFILLLLGSSRPRPNYNRNFYDREEF